MPLKVLVLHGPNVEWTLERDGKPPLRTLGALDAELVARAVNLDAEVRCTSASGEGGLVEVLHASRAWCDAVVVNPSSLAPVAFALADALALLAKPAVEVQLRHEVPGRGRSALKGVVEKQYQGHGTEGYFRALEAVVKSARGAAGRGTVTKKLAVEPSRPERRAEKPRAEKPRVEKPRVEKPLVERPRVEKSIGRRPPPADPDASTTPTRAGTPGGAITRSLVREHLAARLGGRASADGFIEWARGAYAAVREGAPVESGQRELLEDVLMLLAASRGASDEVLLALMTRLEA